MSLIELIAGVEAHEATLTVFNADPAVTDELRRHFADRNVRIVADQTASGPEEFAVLARDGEFVTAATVDDLLSRPSGDETEGSSAGDGEPRARGGAGDRVGRPVLDHLDETMFTSYSREDMVAASREIEDRAWRVGNGELHAGFQTLDVLSGESETYDLLGEKADLDVHAYAAAEGEAPETDHYTVHTGRTAELRETWFVAYDGGGYDEAKCALLAEERAPGEFYGFWSYDPETVDYIIDYLTERYGVRAAEDADGTGVPGEGATRGDAGGEESE
ncbi:MULTISPECIES: DICT sensory domain-containing protein [Halorubrum]|uniref:Diguanylate Cyclase and Two-component system sensory domain-containing protein n=1 Tax=Halorubrum sodomense TaxID=35743 RepID=A0A1I6G8Z2_HALSD|nr:MULTISPECIES: DICT sensory domain-containing protein [Halorubrum]TKX53738.1 histidine kinase [Halorubrum sp. SP3]TKX69404.1 histidine kinase [Halorubrum sp. SP9]SFR38620.1 Diguanylate Cyclase and Two-component system sensory domain-containing protein [Halorubrum sodomense]